MSEQLKPCPFCGGAAERIDIEDGENAGGSVIACTVCQASSNVDFEFKENFVSNWNRRSSPIGGEERGALARAIADGFSNGNERYEEASEPQRARYDMAADAILALLQPEATADE